MFSPEQASAAAIGRALELLNQPSSFERTYKTDRDYATTTDFVIEDELRALLHDLTPDIGFLGEERGHTGPVETYWCLDPIDGTTNFTRGLPDFGIALALITDAQPVHGEIALPAHQERYATQDDTAYCNGQRIRISTTSTLPEAVVSVGDFATGPGSVEKNRRRMSTLSRLADTVGRVRMLGSAATDLAWLAAGRLDAVVIHSNKPWDVAAGIAIAQAAGAVVTHHDGSPYSITGPNVLAAAPRIHAAIVAALDRQRL